MSHHNAMPAVSTMAALALAWPGPARAEQPQYEIIDLGTLGGWTSVAIAVNDVGQVVGSADTPEGYRHAFLWEDGEMQDLGTLPNRLQSEAWDVNNLGQVVGWTGNTGFITSGFVWENGEMINVGHLSGASSGDTDAYGINDSGQVVGGSLVDYDVYHAYMWEDGVMTDITTVYGVPAGSARDINEDGEVIAGSKLLESDGNLTTLPTLGGDRTQGFALNDAGDVAGWSERVPGSALFYPFFWDHDTGEMVDLGAMTGDQVNNRARGVNNSRQVVFKPFHLYDHATRSVHNLHDLIPSDSGWSELNPYDINDGGQLVGAGTIEGTRHAFLMTPIIPIPTVSDWGMVVMALLILVGGTILLKRGRRAFPEGIDRVVRVRS